ncbi:MAG: hypothetical protein LBL79_02985, partial [Prevotella sp.]|nr:hypothetical protein [Prevotella sp.]
VIISGLGPDLGLYNPSDLQIAAERREIKILYSQGFRIAEQLYNFRIFVGDAHIDLQAVYHLGGEETLVWQVKEAAIPSEFSSQKDDLLNWIQPALMSYSAQADPVKAEGVETSGLALSTGPEVVQVPYSILQIEGKLYPFFKLDFTQFWVKPATR